MNSDLNHSPFEGFTRLQDLFETSLSLRSSIETDRSSIESDDSEYRPVGWGRITSASEPGPEQPARITRGRRAELYPDVDVDEALERF